VGALIIFSHICHSRTPPLVVARRFQTVDEGSYPHKRSPRAFSPAGALGVSQEGRNAA
jgi:hypothetical protein